MDPSRHGDPWAGLGPIPSEDYLPFSSAPRSYRVSELLRELDEQADQVESVADRPQTVSEQEVTSRAPHGASVPARKRVSKGGRSRAAKSGRQEVGEESVAPEDPARPNPQSDDVTEEGEMKSRRKVIKKRMKRAFKDGSAIQFFRNKAGDKGYFAWPSAELRKRQHNRVIEGHEVTTSVVTML